ncbi:hypothetical protein KW791_00355 [Candidatus Parcubacteria bacterium]|nr:hypothetical protein [Candidatus Parcubacteria bacterium]
MVSINSILKAHWVGIVLAISAGVISIAPQIYLLHDPNYRGIQMLGTDAEYFYMGQANRALYEDYSKGPFPNDPGKSYYLTPKLGERMLALLSKVFGLSVIDLNVVLKFVGPVLLFGILYGWIFELSSSRSLASLSPLFVIFGINLLNPRDLLNLRLLHTSLDSFLPYTRPFSPLISSLFLFPGLWGIHRLVSKGLSLRSSIALGLITGFSLYEYVYTWTILTVVLGLYFLYFFILRDKTKIKSFIPSLLTHGVISLPVFLNSFKARLDPDYIYTTARHGLVHTRTPILGSFVILGFLALLFLWPKKFRDIRHFFLFVFLALIIVLNQQIITGFTIQPGHYHWFYVKPLCVIVVGFIVIYWIEKIVSIRKWATLLFVSIGLVLLFNGIVIQTNSYKANYHTFIKNQNYAPLLYFFDDSYPQEKNIWANYDLSVLIESYTHHSALNIFDYYSKSETERRNGIFLEYRLRGVSDKNITEIATQEKDYIISSLFGVYYRDLPGSDKIQDLELQKFIQGYFAFVKAPLQQAMKGLNIDLIVVDKNSNLEELSFLQKVYKDDRFIIYQSL